MMYVQDHDEILPLMAYQVPASYVYPNGSTGGGYVLWYHPLIPYIKNYGVFNCASSQSKYTGGYHPPGGYGGNQRVFTASGLSLANMNYPSETAAAMDAGWDRAGNTTIDLKLYTADAPYYLLDWDETRADNAPAPAPRHSEQTNAVYLDGHAKSIQTAKILANGDGTWPVEQTARRFWDPAAP